MEQEKNEKKVNLESGGKQKLTPVLTLLENSINVWWKNLRKFIEMYLVGLLYSVIPLAIIFISLLIFEIYKDNLSFVFGSLFLIALLISVLVFAYFSIRAYIGIFLLVKKDYQGNIKEIFKETKGLVGPYIALSFFTVILILLWSLLLIIPGIIFSIFYSLAVYVFFFEGKTGMAALKRSKELVRGYWWAVAGRFLLFALIVWIFIIIISAPIMLVPEESLFFKIWDIVVQVISVIIGPISLLFSYQIYQDLVKIKK